MRDKRGTKLQIRSGTLKEKFEATREEEKRSKNLRDNKKERIGVNREECELRRGNREQHVANLHKMQQTYTKRPRWLYTICPLAFARSSNVLRLVQVANMGAAKPKKNDNHGQSEIERPCLNAAVAVSSVTQTTILL